MSDNTQPSKRRILKSLGFSSSSLGAFGAIHNVCHYTCQAVIALLAIAGISIVGMPFGFLLNPYLVIIFSAIGLISIILSMVLHLRFLKNSDARLITDRKIIIAAVFGVLSVFSLISGVNNISAEQKTEGVSDSGAVQSYIAFSVDNPLKTSDEGTVGIVLNFEGLSSEGMHFSIEMDATDMSSPPLNEQYDLKELSHFVVENETIAEPISWSIKDVGHMGHHVKGELIFPLTEKEQLSIMEQAESFEMIITDVGGISRRVFTWNIK